MHDDAVIMHDDAVIMHDDAVIMHDDAVIMHDDAGFYFIYKFTFSYLSWMSNLF